MERLQALVTGFDPEIPIERAVTPPSSWYTSPEIYELERRTVFARTFQPLARLEEVPENGSFSAGHFMDEPYVVVREGEEVRAFFNVCRHHATCVAEGKGRTDELVCPYHGWRYGLDGSLRKAPRMAGVEKIDRARFGLRPMDCENFGPFVFARVQPGDAPGPGEMLASVREALRLDGLKFVERKTYEIQCNWKVFVDNYLDGGYHVEHMHPGLAGQLALKSYRTTVDAWTATQTVGGGSNADTGMDFQARLGEEAVYVWAYPGLMLNRYGPWLDSNWVVPLGPDRTLTVFDYFIDEGRANEREFIERSLQASHKVQEEDIAVCEAVQRGLRSSSYDVGVYAPKLEHGAHQFHRMLAAAYRQGLEQPS